MRALLVAAVALALAGCGGGSDEPDPELDARLLEAVRANQVADYVETVRLLVDAGADVTIADVHGITLLQHAGSAGHGQIAAILRDAGATR